MRKYQIRFDVAGSARSAPSDDERASIGAANHDQETV